MINKTYLKYNKGLDRVNWNEESTTCEAFLIVKNVKLNIFSSLKKKKKQEATPPKLYEAYSLTTNFELFYPSIVKSNTTRQ